MDSTEKQNDFEAKQALLTTEIAEKGLDRQQFVDFVTQKKPYGDDLNNWTLDELKQLIEEFKGIAANAQQPTEEQVPEENMEIMADETKEEKEKTYITVNCRKLEKNELNDKEIHVLIQDPKPIETGFLQQNYVAYQVVTQELNWNVQRRFSDFEWLRLMLIKFNTGYVVPPLPNKKIGSRRFEVDFIAKRMKGLQKFIDVVMLNENFKACEALYTFLTITDRSQFDSKMKELNSYILSPYVEEFKTFTGTVNIANEEEDNEKYFSNIGNYFRIQSSLYDRLNFNLKKFFNCIRDASDALADAEKDFEAFDKLNKKVLMKEKITKTYETLGHFFKNWRAILLNQNVYFKKYIKDFFKYMKADAGTYEELIKSREDIKNKYLTEKTRLNNKKERLWAQMDITKWEIIDQFNKIDPSLLMKDKIYAFENMLTTETQSVDNIHKQLGYANKMNTEELKKLMNFTSQKIVSMIKSFPEVFYPTLSDGINIWSGLNTYL